MKVYIINESRSEFDCGDASANIISLHSSKEGANAAFDKYVKEVYVNPDRYKARLINDYIDEKFAEREHILRNEDYQNYCCNLTLQIIEKEVED